jgi:pimeloyl-ACP methyl ester carboxylesterase
LPPGKPNAMAMLTAPRPPKDNRDAAITFGVNVYKALAGLDYPSAKAELRARVECAFDRSNYPAGIARQLIAVLASGRRVELLKTIRVPTLVLHGADDPLPPMQGGRDTARHVPWRGAEDHSRLGSRFSQPHR